ncbi:MAG: amidohydrolase family protein [Myxococcota bacterium]|nr:amidohydrolase family protein [Myxococcota bacterium]
MHDLVIRNGRVIDGSGGEALDADVAVRDGRIVELGRIAERGARELDAEGLLVTPGWVDVHTHYDGQATWDPYLSPSCWHGVTTVVMGNCGVGFAPAAPDEHDWLISLMEGVEDIPGTALAEGLTWDWRSFPDYLDALERRELAVDVGAQLPHAALRAYVMGRRGGDHTAVPTAPELEQMAALACEAVLAGAIGFTTSRTRNHRSRDGELTPSLTATEDELLAIGRGLREAGCGVIEAVGDFADLDSEFALLRKMVETSGRPMSISVLQTPDAPGGWRKLLDLIGRAADDGLPIKAQVATRPIGVLLGLETTIHPFSGHPSFAPLHALPHARKLEQLRDPELRARLLAEQPPERLRMVAGRFENIFVMHDPPDYEPSAELSVASIARQRGVSPAECALDLMLERDGHTLLYSPFANYADGDLGVVREMLLSEHTVPGLGDGGAHVGLICDGSFPTSLVTLWGRDRSRGEGLPLEWLVHQQTRATAELVGFHDRGLIAPGMKADLNLIDWEALRVHPPEILYDLPAGGRRLVQRASGYVATVVSGEVTHENGKPTGALPGKLVRGAQRANA